MRVRWYGKAVQAAGAGVLLLALAACTGGGKNTAPSAAPGATVSPGAGAAAGASASPGAGGTAAVNAEALFKQNCVACHGETLDGNGAPQRNLQKVGSRYSAEQIMGIVTNGRNGMPSYKGRLKDEEIHVLAEWLAAKK